MLNEKKMQKLSALATEALLNEEQFMKFLTELYEAGDIEEGTLLGVVLQVGDLIGFHYMNNVSFDASILAGGQVPFSRHTISILIEEWEKQIDGRWS